MENFLKNIEIKNFKSIKNVKLNNCNKINLIIGKPNVGKSNLLEALSFFSLPFAKTNYSSNQKLNNFIRLENPPELFFDGNLEKKIEIKTNICSCIVHYAKTENFSKRLMIEISDKLIDKIYKYTLDEKLNIKKINKSGIPTFRQFSQENNGIKKYTFNPNIKYKNINIPILLPPFGINILNAIDVNKNLKQELLKLFSEHNLKLVFDKAGQSLKIMKENKDNEVFLLPYNSIADTLQRLIFFKTAIASNENSVLLFEEPEAHSFPPYIVEITQDIIRSTTNQYFISTHSPNIVEDFLENCREDLSIFIANYKNGETIIKQLSQNELTEVYQYGVDLFANNKSYL